MCELVRVTTKPESIYSLGTIYNPDSLRLMLIQTMLLN